MAFRVVQQVSARSSGSAASVSTGAIATTTGNLLVACVFSFGNNIGATPISDSEGNTWTAALSSTGSSNGFAAVFTAVVAAGDASHTVTFTPSSSDFIVIVVYEIEDADAADPVNEVNSSTSSTTTHSSGSITAGDTDEMFIGGCAISSVGEGGGSNPTKFWSTSIAGQSSTATTMGWRASVYLAASGESNSFDVTLSAADNETIFIVGIKSDASSGGGSGGGGGSFVFG